MLERALTTYAGSEEGKQRPVWVALPDLFFPKASSLTLTPTPTLTLTLTLTERLQWDPGAEQNLRDTCQRSHQWEDTCKMLEGRNWDNGPRPESFAIHHWAHTWLGAGMDGGEVTIKEVAGERFTRPPV